MNWSLFLSDFLARVLGVIGLIASVAWIAGVIVSWPGAGASALFGAGGALFCLTMTVFFLIPKVHDRMMRRTAPTWFRAPFQLLGTAWIVCVIAGLFLARAALDGALPMEVPWLVWLVATGVTAGIALLLICPIGLAWKEPLLEREAARATLSVD